MLIKPPNQMKQPVKMKMTSRILHASSRSLSSSAVAHVHRTLINTHARSRTPDLLPSRTFSRARSSFQPSNAFSDASWRAAYGVCSSSGNLGVKLGGMRLEKTVSPPYLMSCGRLIHSGSPKEFEARRNASPRESLQESRRDLFRGSSFARPITARNAGNVGVQRNARSMDFVREVVGESKKDSSRGSQFTRPGTETNADIVHIKLLKNNTFVTLTDSKGNRKVATTAGVLKGKKGERKKSRLASEATAEHIGQAARDLGSKSVVMKVNGFALFKKKRQAILSWRDGYTNKRGGHCPIVHIEDTTRLPHNGCRLPKRRSV